MQPPSTCCASCSASWSAAPSQVLAASARCQGRSRCNWHTHQAVLVHAPMHMAPQIALTKHIMHTAGTDMLYAEQASGITCTCSTRRCVPPAPSHYLKLACAACLASVQNALTGPGVQEELGVAYSGAASATALSQVVGGPIAATILLLDGKGGLWGWQWLFILIGCPTVLFGALVKARHCYGRAYLLAGS